MTAENSRSTNEKERRMAEGTQVDADQEKGFNPCGFEHPHPGHPCGQSLGQSTAALRLRKWWVGRDFWRQCHATAPIRGGVMHCTHRRFHRGEHRWPR